MNRFLKHWRLTGCGEAFRDRVVSYADDFVILSRGRAAEALTWTKAVNNEPRSEVRDELNRCLRGWSNYFCQGTRRPVVRSIDHYVTERVRAFLTRRHKVQGRGNRQFTFEVIHGERGVLGMERLLRRALLWA